MFMLLSGAIALVLFVILIFTNLFKGGFKLLDEVRTPLGIAMLCFAIFAVLSRSFIYVGNDETAHLERVYGGKALEVGRILATEGYKGPQTKLYGPGFHFVPFINVIYDVSNKGVLNVPEGHYAKLTAKDGAPLRENQFIADAWEEVDGGSRLKAFEDAEYFLTEINGQKGPQLTVVPPGAHRYNHFLFDTEIVKANDFPTGTVAVIRSNVNTSGGECPNIAKSKGVSGQSIAKATVPKFCVGVWDEALPPKQYYLNDSAYTPVVIPTRLQAWEYKGGYTTRKINLNVDVDGSITQLSEDVTVTTPPGAAGGAIMVRVEGWTFPVDVRVLLQVSPADAPNAVASIGTLDQIRDTVITPALRDLLRTIGGEKERKVLDFVEKRDEISQKLEDALVEEGRKVGVTIQEVKLGETVIPPELLVARLREQLAKQLTSTYTAEKIAQTNRIEVEKEKAKADQQHILMAAEIDKLAATQRKAAAKLDGEGEKERLLAISVGQKAQVDVLGEDRVMNMQMLKEILATAERQPDIVKVPVVNVQSSSGGLEGSAAILGASNIVELFQNKKVVK